MKKKLLFTVMLLILSFDLVLANSAPTTWQAYPLSESLIIDSTNEIAINSEHLVFDFNDEDIPDWSYWLSAAVSATYQMENTSDDEKIVTMLFPFVDQLSTIDVDLLKISADQEAIDYRLLISNSDISDEVIAELSGFTTGAIDNDVKLDQDAVLYQINAATADEAFMSIELQYSDDDIIVIGFDDLGGYQYDGEQTDHLSGTIEKEKTLYLLVLNGDVRIDIAGYTDYQMESEKAIDHALSKTTVNAQSYLLDYLKADIEPKTLAKLTDDQLANVISSYIDEQGSRYFCDWDLKAILDSEHLYGMYYQVRFAPQETREVTVNYLINGTMDRSETIDPVYHFTYLLSPAKNWSSFKDLTVDIYTPEDNRHIIDSSVSLDKISDDHYQFKSAELIDSELEFSLYANEDIDLGDKIAKVLGNWRYVLIFFGPLAIIMVGMWLFLNRKLKMKNEDKRRSK